MIKTKDLQPRHLVWVHLRKDRFPKLRNNKLKPKVDGPFLILHNVSDNAYTVDLMDTYGVHTTFNIQHW